MILFTNQARAGYLPMFFSENDPRPAREQLHESYAHGGGVQPFKGFELQDFEAEGRAKLKYPGDPPMTEISRAKLRDETIVLFTCDWVAIVQSDGTYLVTRVD